MCELVKWPLNYEGKMKTLLTQNYVYVSRTTKLYSLPDPPTLPRTVPKELLEFATKKSHFIFNGQYYDQIYGVAMGSPLGPVIANIFVSF